MKVPRLNISALRVRVTSLKKQVAGLKGQLGTTNERFELAQKKLDGYKNLVDTLPVGLHTLNRKGIITRVNSTEAEMLGYQRHEMIGRKFTEFIPEDQRQEAWDRFQEKWNGKAVDKIAHRTYVRKDGSLINVTSEDKVLKDESGKPTEIVTVLINITEINRVKDREKTRALEQIVAGVCHVFNNNSMVTIGNADMIVNIINKLLGELPDSVTRALRSIRSRAQIIVEEGQRGFEVIQQMRRLTESFSSGPLIIDPLIVIKDALDKIEEEARQNNIVIIQNFKPTSEVDVVPRDFYQAMINLLKNSIEAMPNGGKIFVVVRERTFQKRQSTVNSKQLEPGKKYVVITVADTGPGISEEDRPHVFDMFHTTVPSRPGLGLSEVLSIAERHSGGIKLSTGSKGTRVHLYFPAVDEN